MKTKFLKIENPCHENWENMTPNEKGRFCDSCKKTVIDFTQSTPLQIAQELKKSRNLCVRMSSKQLRTPLLELKTYNDFKLPYANLAVGLMIATTLSCNQNLPAPNTKSQTEMVPMTDTSSKSEKQTKNSNTSIVVPENTTRFCGIVMSENGDLIENAKITFVTLHKRLSTYSLQDGTFSIDLPSDLVDNENVFMITYHDVETIIKNDSSVFRYMPSDYVLTKNDMNSEYEIKAKSYKLTKGRINFAFEEGTPIVLINNKEVPYKEFIEEWYGEKKSCNLENKDYYYFESKAAKALYGKKAKSGLYLFYDKE